MPPPRFTAVQRRTIAALALCVLAAGLDHMIINVGLPALGRDLGAQTRDLQWIVSGYVIAFTASLLLAGRLGDRFGRRRTLLAGLAVFAAGTVLSALSSSAPQLTAGRAVLGVGGSLLLSSALSTVTAVFPQPVRPRAIAIWSASFSAGVVLGPLAGGSIIDRLGWRSAFWITVPLIAVAAAAVLAWVPETRDPGRPRLGLDGAALSATGLAVVLAAVIDAPGQGWWSARTLAVGATGLALLAGFVLRQLHGRDPLLDLRVFASPAVRAAAATLALLGAATAGGIFALIQYLQLVLGLSPLQAGAGLLPAAAATAAGSALSARLQAGPGPRVPIVAGSLTCAAGLVLLLVADVGSPYLTAAAALAAFTGGSAMAGSAATTVIAGGLPPERAGITSALNDGARQVGSAVGTAALGSLLAWRYTRSLGPLPDLPPQARTRARDGVTSALALVDDGTAPAWLARTADQAFVSGMHAMAIGSAGLAVLAALLWWRPAGAPTGRRPVVAVSGTAAGAGSAPASR